MALTTQLDVSVRADLTSALDLLDASAPLRQTFRVALQSGTGLNQADRIWSDTRTVNASSSENHDLAGSLTDALGGPFSLARVKGLIVASRAANTHNIGVGGDVTNTWLTWVGAETDSVVVRPGGVFALFAPDATAYAVTASTGDLLKIANLGAVSAVTYDIVIVGASA